MDSKGPQELLEWATRERPVPKELPAPKAILDWMVSKANKEQLAIPATLVLLAHKEIPEQLAQADPLAQQGHKVLMVLTVVPDKLDLQEQLGHRAPQAPRA